jgi:DNA helicase-2/ATP-dependent DNA helicase PcrA
LLNSIKEWVDNQQNLAQIDEDGILLEPIEDSAFPESPLPPRPQLQLAELSLGTYLQQITLLTDADEKDPNADTVKLMTIHAAKGLEFSCVFAAGLEEMLFPNAMSVNTREELEEERRLFYVVITRAKYKLWITYANTRYRFGSVVQNEPSRFLSELPEQYLDRSFAGGGARNQSFFGTAGGSSAYERMHQGFGNSFQEGKTETPPRQDKNQPPSYLASKSFQKTVEHTPSLDFIASDTSLLQEGQRVEHPKFGFGKVVKMEGSAHNPIATVQFELNGEKKIMLHYAKLRILD